MGFFVGILVVSICVLGGYAIPGGHISILFQPYEFVIIFGAAIGAFIIANPHFVIKKTLSSLKLLIKRTPYSKKSYIDLLSFLFITFKLIKTKGILEIESSIENPKESELFMRYPKIVNNKTTIEFFCDTIRMLCIGMNNYHQIEESLEVEIELYHSTGDSVGGAIAELGEGLPALGIVAAVLGVIHTMGSISEPPEVLGHLIGAALVGTFSGVLFSYGVVGPMAGCIKKYSESETKYLEVIKTAILANMQGHSPTITAELARKAIPPLLRPSFNEMDEILNSL